MNDNRELVALLLGEGERPGEACPDAECVVRDADGRMSVEAVGSADELQRAARATGCFKRGKPILDPMTREVIGYEMEPVESALSPPAVTVSELLDLPQETVLEP